MARRVQMLPCDPDCLSGDGDEQTAAEWLVAEMAIRRISNNELFARMRRAGFTGTSPNVISMWRAGTTPVSLETLPYLLDGLRMEAHEQCIWSRAFLRAAHPVVWDLAAWAS